MALSSRLTRYKSVAAQVSVLSLLEENIRLVYQQDSIPGLCKMKELE